MKHDLAHPLEQHIYKDSVERITARYVEVKYGYSFTGVFLVSLLCVLWLILCPIVLVEFPSSDPRLLMQIIAFFCGASNDDLGDFRLPPVSSSIGKR